MVSPIKAILYEGKELTIIRDGEDIGPVTRRMWTSLTDIQVRLRR